MCPGYSPSQSSTELSAEDEHRTELGPSTQTDHMNRLTKY